MTPFRLLVHALSLALTLAPALAAAPAHAQPAAGAPTLDALFESFAAMPGLTLDAIPAAERLATRGW